MMDERLNNQNYETRESNVKFYLLIGTTFRGEKRDDGLRYKITASQPMVFHGRPLPLTFDDTTANKILESLPFDEWLEFCIGAFDTYDEARSRVPEGYTQTYGDTDTEIYEQVPA